MVQAGYYHILQNQQGITPSCRYNMGWIHTLQALTNDAVDR